MEARLTTLPRPPRHHPPERRPSPTEGAGQRDVEDTIPVAVSEIGDPGVAAQTSVVDNDVDRSVGVFGSIEQLLDGT